MRQSAVSRSVVTQDTHTQISKFPKCCALATGLTLGLDYVLLRSLSNQGFYKKAPNIIIFTYQCSVRSLLPLTSKFSTFLWSRAASYLALLFTVFDITASIYHTWADCTTLYFLNLLMHKLFLHWQSNVVGRSGKGFSIQKFSGFSITCNLHSHK